MRRISSLVLAASVLFPLSFANAATEVAKLSSNNQFADATSTDDTGATIAVFLTREKTKGQPRDSIFVIFSTADATAAISGTLPHGAVHMDAKSASVDVAVGDIVPIFQFGDLPPDAVISVDWHAGNVTRDNGNVTEDMGGGFTSHTVGHFTSAEATASGSVFGAPFTATTADVHTAHQMVVTKFMSQ